MGKPLSVLVVGGTGHWSETNHYPALLALRREGLLNRVVGICDPCNPYEAPQHHYADGRPHLREVLQADRPDWINPAGMDEAELEQVLQRYSQETPIDLAIISCDPVCHFFYASWALRSQISVVCDKPPVLEPRASFCVDSARRIIRQHTALIDLVQAQRASHPQLMFYVPLSRRLNQPFQTIAHGLSEVFERTGQGITSMLVQINNGLHRCPAEFLKGGAHGYRAGVGALAHTSYHLLDVIAWYLGAARGAIHSVGISVPYVHRIADYLRAKTYQPLMQLLEQEAVDEPVDLPPEVVNAELDFTVHLTLYDAQGQQLGLAVYASNHTSATPRLALYDPATPDPANQRLGGRMQQIFIDVHQGALQNYVLRRDDVVFLEKKRTEVVRRLHPRLGTSYEKLVFADEDHEAGMRPVDVFRSCVQRLRGAAVPAAHEHNLHVWMTERLTYQLFACTYEKMAERFGSPLIQETRISLT